MTNKKYVLTFIVFALLLILVLILFFVGLSFKETNEVVFCIFAAGAFLCLIAAIFFIAIKYKELIAYDERRINKMISNLDYSVMDVSIPERDLRDRLIHFGYTENKEIFHKVSEDNCGDGIVVNNYYVTIHKMNKEIDFQKIIECYNKGMTTYNIGYVFLDENIEDNLGKTKEYIIETIKDVKMHAYNYQKFFVPIIITKDRVFYVKEAGIFMDAYMFGVIEAVRVVNNR